jgi:hypothetical protein
VPQPRGSTVGRATSDYCAIVLHELANRWDAVELWVTQLAFPFQVVLAILVVLPLCWTVAGLVDRAVDAVVLLGSRRPPTRRSAATPPADRT